MSAPEEPLACKVLDASDHVGKHVGTLGECVGQEKSQFGGAALDPFDSACSNLFGRNREVESSGELEVQSELDPADSALCVGRGFGAMGR